MSDDQPPAPPRPTGGPGITRFATRDGHRLSYESIGASDGVSVLGLHDLLADRGQFRPLADALPLDRFRLTLSDARGHGASPMISGRFYPTAELVADALAVLDAEGLSSVHIVAVGWGAGIALGLAAAVPERIASLVLAAPFLPALIGDDEMQETLRRAADAAEKGQTDRALDLYVGLRVGPDWRDGLPKARLGVMRRAAGSLAPLLSGAMESSTNQAALSRLDMVILLFSQNDSPDHESNSAGRLAGLLEAATIERFPLAASASSAMGEVEAPAIARALLTRVGS